MCAIAGIKGGNVIEVEKMLDAMESRGRDDSKVIVTMVKQQAWTLGHRLMRVMGQNATQPTYRDGLVLMMNGYVHTIGGTELPKDEVDTEYVADHIHRHGLKGIHDLNGMFALCFAIGETLYIARDRFGAKPLYYYHKGDKFIFASSIQAIMSQLKRIEIDEDAVEEWFALQNYLDNKTLYKDIKLLPKGSWMNLNTMKITKYHKWRREVDRAAWSQEEVNEEARFQILRAFDRHTYNHEASQWLSGGIDSYLINEHINSISNTFSCIYQEKKFSEIDNIIRAQNGEKHLLMISKNDIRKYSRKVAKIMPDLRMGQSYSNLRLAELTGKYTRVNYQGTGGDELFMGYHWRYGQDKYDANFKTEYFSESLRYRFDKAWEECDEDQRIWDMEYFLEGLLLVGDAISMANHYEDRAPFCDNDLARFAITKPEFYMNDKKAIREAFILTSYLKEYPKRGFTNPDSIWMSEANLTTGEYRSFIDYEIDQKNSKEVWCAFMLEQILDLYPKI